MELKQTTEGSQKWNEISFNRTFMELKHESKRINENTDNKF